MGIQGATEIRHEADLDQPKLAKTGNPSFNIGLKLGFLSPIRSDSESPLMEDVEIRETRRTSKTGNHEGVDDHTCKTPIASHTSGEADVEKREFSGSMLLVTKAGNTNSSWEDMEDLDVEDDGVDINGDCGVRTKDSLQRVSPKITFESQPEPEMAKQAPRGNFEGDTSIQFGTFSFQAMESKNFCVDKLGAMMRTRRNWSLSLQ
ncbi:hypothetical protein FRX31_026794 [Thalictrum thalictroides]|uniref:Uncharacterized protein n=1 Tax=Thalictrum thalictroides TaxID=46969 RepID=A0A7J6VEV6_THATH|nr:hypothetical protein FRX31_026794 [Thalictrum thalictroides]